MRRMTADQARQYWIEHSQRRAPLNLESDPDALDNCCHPGVPAWLNAYYARQQTRIYLDMLARIPPPKSADAALDVGCGGGRWCRLLQRHGYSVVGVDLQRSLIEANQQRYADIAFVCSPLEDYTAPKPFALLSCVTVLQHHPPSAQSAMIRHLRNLMGLGGHAIILENIHDQGAHVFANSPQRWINLFSDAGFALRHTHTYDHSPLLRSHALMLRAIGSVGVRLGRGPMPRLREALRHPLLWRNLMRLDDLGETLYQRVGVGAVHCGFLFQAV